MHGFTSLRFLQRHCPSTVRELAHKQFVLPVFEYCLPIWDPYHQKYLRQVKMVPHRELLVLFWSDHGENIETVTLKSFKPIRMASIRGTMEPEVCYTDSVVMIMIMKVATTMNLSFALATRLTLSAINIQLYLNGISL